MMGQLYWEWIKQYQATDQLMTLMFGFGLLLMFGFYGSSLLPWDDAQIRWIRNLQAAMIIAVIALTLAAPSLVDHGIIVME